MAEVLAREYVNLSSEHLGKLVLLLLVLAESLELRLGCRELQEGVVVLVIHLDDLLL